MTASILVRTAKEGGRAGLSTGSFFENSAVSMTRMIVSCMIVFHGLRSPDVLHPLG